MNNKANHSVLPKLRFPEFRSTDGWAVPKLGSIGSFTGGGTPSKEKSDYWRGVNPWVSSSDISQDGIQDISISRYISDEAIRATATKVIPANSILLVSRVGVGKLAISRAPICTSQDFTNFTPNKDDLVFLAYCIKSLKAKLLAFNQGMAIKGFTKDDVSGLGIPLPKLAEQQKIADCLSSLDELIAAQARKVDALKTHKEGLMQQLFPREGETQPRLRFSEFRGSESWKSGSLISLSDAPLSNGVFNDPKKVGSGYKLINVSDMYIDTVIDEDKLSLVELSPSDFTANQVKYGDIFFTRSSLVKSGIAVSNIYLGSSTDVTFDGHLIRFRPDIQKIFPVFSHYLFKTSLVREQLIARGKTATMTTIGQTDVASVTLFSPETREQQQIVDCLIPIDNLITAAAQELKALKTHKKGLMQQLFPSAEAVEA